MKVRISDLSMQQADKIRFAMSGLGQSGFDGNAAYEIVRTATGWVFDTENGRLAEVAIDVVNADMPPQPTWSREDEEQGGPTFKDGAPEWADTDAAAIRQEASRVGLGHFLDDELEG